MATPSELITSRECYSESNIIENASGDMGNILFAVPKSSVLMQELLPTYPATKKRRVQFQNPCSSILSTCGCKSVATKQAGNNSMKHSISCSSLPSLSSSSDEGEMMLRTETLTAELDLNVSPSVFLKQLVLHSKCLAEHFSGQDVFTALSERVKQDSYFVALTEEEQQGYDNVTVNAVQNKDVEVLRSLLRAGHIMQTSNRFGESLLHTACRRGFTDVVEFFLNEAGVSPRIRDDMSRTPMHDVCWSSSGPNHAAMKMLITSAPELLLSKDCRGHSPFDYARREHWPNWVAFLNDNRFFIERCLLESACLATDEVANATVPLKNQR